MAALIAAILAAAILVRSANSTDQEKVDTALTKLGLATQGVELDKRIGRVASSNLSKRRAVKRAKILESQAVDLRLEATETDGADQIVAGANDSIAALNEISRVARGVQKSRKLIDSSDDGNINPLRVSRKLLSNLGSVSVGKLLSSSLSSYQASIEESVAELEKEDSLPDKDSDVADPGESIEQIAKLRKGMKEVDRVQSEQIAKLIRETKDKETALLLEPPGTDCGETSSGFVVLITSGEGICDELLAVADQVDRSAGNGLYSAPDGWSCGSAPITPSGNEGAYATGFGCSNGSVEISVFLSRSQIAVADSVAAAAEAANSEPECPPGQEYVSAPHIQECVVVEGDESED